MPSNAFDKSRRLLKAADFQKVFDKSQFRVSERYFLFLAIQNSTDKARLGLVVGKKAIRHAVQRNRIKRVVRETFRTNESGFPSIDIIFLARRGLDEISGAEFAKTLNRALQSLPARVRKG